MKTPITLLRKVNKVDRIPYMWNPRNKAPDELIRTSFRCRCAYMLATLIIFKTIDYNRYSIGVKEGNLDVYFNRVSKRTVQRAFKELVDRHIIIKIKKHGNPIRYRFNRNYKEWLGLSTKMEGK